MEAPHDKVGDWDAVASVQVPTADVELELPWSQDVDTVGFGAIMDGSVAVTDAAIGAKKSNDGRSPDVSASGIVDGVHANGSAENKLHMEMIW